MCKLDGLGLLEIGRQHVVTEQSLYRTLLIFFILPVKIKYLAILDGVLYLLGFVFGTWASRAAILLSLVNVVIFFGGSGLVHLKTQMSYWKTRRNFRKYMK